MANPDATIPTSCTSGALARVCGVSERVIAGRKGDGRLPVTTNGKIDLQMIIAAGVDVYAARSKQKHSAGPEISDDTALTIVASLAAHLVLAAILTRGDGEDEEQAAASGLAAALATIGGLPASGAPEADRLVVLADLAA